jgi:hypothetical protein
VFLACADFILHLDLGPVAAMARADGVPRAMAVMGHGEAEPTCVQAWELLCVL